MAKAGVSIAKSQKAKDGQIRLMALNACKLEEVTTSSATHLKGTDGKLLCRSRAKLVRVTNELPLCGRCHARMSEMVAAKEAEILRTYWMREVEYGGNPQWAERWQKGKPEQTQWEQPGLPEELLPTGTGRLVKELV